MKNTNKNSFREFLLRYTNKLQFPVFLLVFYVPGYLLTAILVSNPYGVFGNVILLIGELLEMKILYSEKGILSKVFLPLIVLHPSLCTFFQIRNWLILILKPDAVLTLTGKTLLRVRTAYVGVAFVCVIVLLVIRKIQKR